MRRFTHTNGIIKKDHGLMSWLGQKRLPVILWLGKWRALVWMVQFWSPPGLCIDMTPATLIVFMRNIPISLGW